MNKKQILKIFLFLICITIFSCFSFIARNILINNFNGVETRFLSIEHISNYGAAFSILNNHPFVLITISIIILIITLFYIFKQLEKLSKSNFIFTALLCSGILCNLSERVIDGFVTDYLKLNFVIFPIFNISDIFICIGAFVLICNILFNDEQPKN